MHGGRPPCGRPVTGTHLPTFDGSLQASHCPPHSLSQQTPSVQKPLPHWVSAPQGVPGNSFATQTPPEQYLPAPQFASVVQPPPQRVPLHTLGAQSCSCCGPQEPSLAQVRASLATPVAHDAAVHTFSVPG
jgi:hypothetical protein